MRRGVLLTSGLLIVLAACARTRPPPLAPFGTTPAVLVVDEDGPWHEIPADDEGPVVVPAPPAAPATRVASHRPPPVAPRAAPPSLDVLPRRATAEPAPKGTPPTKSPADLARERYLDHPTRIRAERVTFYCPPAFLSEVRLTGEDVTESAGGRRIASGTARLLCRELTLEADRIVLRRQREGSANLQITARGDVTFVSEYRGQVIREAGARTLFITNDEVVPLR